MQSAYKYTPLCFVPLMPFLGHSRANAKVARQFLGIGQRKSDPKRIAFVIGKKWLFAPTFLLWGNIDVFFISAAKTLYIT